MHLLGFTYHYNESTRFTCLCQERKINDGPVDDPNGRFKWQGNLKPGHPALSSYTGACGRACCPRVKLSMVSAVCGKGKASGFLLGTIQPIHLQLQTHILDLILPGKGCAVCVHVCVW